MVARDPMQPAQAATVAAMQPSANQTTIGVGDGLPDIVLIDADGANWHTAAHRGRPLVLILHRHLA